MLVVVSVIGEQERAWVSDARFICLENECFHCGGYVKLIINAMHIFRFGELEASLVSY
jgi:hypothetical protein